MPMRGGDGQQAGMFSYVSPEQRIPSNHPLRPIREMTDEVLRQLSRRFAGLYAKTGRPSSAPEKLLRALLLRVLELARAGHFLSDDTSSVDGTLIQAWAGHKSFQRKGTTPPPTDDT